MRSPALGLISVSSLLAGTLSAHAALTFTLAFTPQAQSDFTPAEQAIFQDAINFWDDIIDGHRDGANRTWVLTVDSFSQAASGGGITLGSASVTGVAFSGFVADSHTSNGRFIISTSGAASFNTHPDAGALNPDTIKHEIGHALGIGTLWEDNEIYNDGGAIPSNRTLAGGTPGELVGPVTLATYQAEFDPSATFVPVQLDGGSGAAHAHWNEVDDHWNIENSPGFDSDPGDGGPAPTDPNGRSLDDELMTSVQSGNNWLSATTRASLIDIGFTLHAPVPEPQTGLLAALALLLAFRRQR